MKTYFIKDTRTKMIKIGKSQDPAKRLKSLQTGNPSRLILICTIDDNLEKEIHWMLRKDRRSGEWFIYSKRLRLMVTALNRGVDYWLWKRLYIANSSSTCTGGDL